MRNRMLVSLATCIFVFGCGGGGGGGDEDTPDAMPGSGGARCVATATATANVDSGSITAVGTVQCDQDFSQISVETCLQWNTSGMFEDILCTYALNMDTATLEGTAFASCGASPRPPFRARVTATVDLVEEPEVLSATVSCD